MSGTRWTGPAVGDSSSPERLGLSDDDLAGCYSIRTDTQLIESMTAGG